jgi:hypothetical protein
VGDVVEIVGDVVEVDEGVVEAIGVVVVVAKTRIFSKIAFALNIIKLKSIQVAFLRLLSPHDTDSLSS